MYHFAFGFNLNINSISYIDFFRVYELFLPVFLLCSIYILEKFNWNKTIQNSTNIFILINHAIDMNLKKNGSSFKSQSMLNNKSEVVEIHVILVDSMVYYILII